MSDPEQIEKEDEYSLLILDLLREKAIAKDTQHPGIYSSVSWEKSRTADAALKQEKDRLFYHPGLLCAAFLSDSDLLLKEYVSLCQSAVALRTPCGKNPLFFSGAGGGAKEEETDALSEDSKRDYRKILQKFCVPREEPVLDLDSFDYIPYVNSLKEGLLQVEPLEYKEVNRLDELAIAIDTSGSCSGELVQRFLKETCSILRQRENFFSRMRVLLIQCDSMIQDVRVITDFEEWEEMIPRYRIKGHGDTDFCPVFDLIDELYLKKEIRSLRALLYFTDGDGIYPVKAPPYETVFVFVDEKSEKGKIPGWAARVNLGEIL